MLEATGEAGMLAVAGVRAGETPLELGAEDFSRIAARFFWRMAIRS